MRPDLQGRIALVTGASRGIGAALAKALAAAGAHVVLLARTQGALEEVDDAIRAEGGSATLLPMDLGKAGEAERLGSALQERFGRLDILAANAGMLGPLTPAHQVAAKDWERVLRVNFLANTQLARGLDPLLRASDAGRMVFVSSGLAEKGMAYWGPYAASKAALEIFVTIYAAETLHTNMKINLVRPGVVRTAMLNEAFPGGYGGEAQAPEAVATQIVPLLSPACDRHGEIVSL